MIITTKTKHGNTFQGEAASIKEMAERLYGCFTNALLLMTGENTGVIHEAGKAENIIATMTCAYSY